MILKHTCPNHPGARSLQMEKWLNSMSFIVGTTEAQEGKGHKSKMPKKPVLFGPEWQTCLLAPCVTTDLLMCGESPKRLDICSSLEDIHPPPSDDGNGLQLARSNSFLQCSIVKMTFAVFSTLQNLMGHCGHRRWSSRTASSHK